MPQPHQIRLQGPWMLLDPPRKPTRVQLPDEWSEFVSLGESTAWSGHLTRHFNAPTGLMPGDRVELILCGFPAECPVYLNDDPIGMSPPDGKQLRVEITGQLASRNMISVDLSQVSAPHETPPQAHLEIFAG